MVAVVHTIQYFAFKFFLVLPHLQRSSGFLCARLLHRDWHLSTSVYKLFFFSTVEASRGFHILGKRELLCEIGFQTIYQANSINEKTGSAERFRNTDAACLKSQAQIDIKSQ